MNRLFALFGRLAPLLGFRGSRNYWETRYRLGGHSGEGSRGVAADYKARVLNDFFRAQDVRSAIEFGCGDGHQLKMLHVPAYIGVDVSQTVLKQCRDLFEGDATKRFVSVDDYAGERADASMSIDVIFHLVEDAVYDEYLARLFAAGERFVIVYSTSADMPATGIAHVRHRDVAADIARRFPGFTRMEAEEAMLPPPVRADRGLPVRFFLYRRD
ncbi:Methyltransferase family protein [Lysobacter dokdonensis DS-58]|uniref:Methyltransferase family protein n=1 Tax=Lysobacter dokdonensis DS-58 TaxID=1300345 RepID=A0A0A2WPX5_9GAMM|nr:class I SAM-dependent methyltransferase [Lysobacter dokdonensis]KGQ20807.1 Methyltransferase family protein [Lysobacter dokdonensis DS-58]